MDQHTVKDYLKVKVIPELIIHLSITSTDMYFTAKLSV